MNGDDIKRLFFYEKQYLGARDFQDEQNYHVGMRRRHLIAPHTWGVVEGLNLKKNEKSGIWSVQPGLAVDGFGREVCVFHAEPLDLEQIGEQLQNSALPARLKIWVAYRAEKTLPPAGRFAACEGADEFMRVRETFRLVYQNDPPFDGGDPGDPQQWPKAFTALPADFDAAQGGRWPVYLGEITWDRQDPAKPKKIIKGVDETGRRYAGLSLGADAGAVPMRLYRRSLAAGKSDLVIQVGGLADGGERLVVGPLDASAPGEKVREHLVVSNNGGVEIAEQLTARGEVVAQKKLTVGGVLTANGDVQAQQKLTVQGEARAEGGLTVAGGKNLDVNGGQISLRDASGGEDTDPLRIYRKHRGADQNDMVLQIGDNLTKGDRLVVGSLPAGETDVREQFVVWNNGDAAVANSLTAKNLFGKLPFRLAAGRTTPAQVTWDVWKVGNVKKGLRGQVNISPEQFEATPLYLVTLHGVPTAIGGMVVGEETAQGFTVFVTQQAGAVLTPQTAKNDWRLEWLAVQI